MNGPRSEAVRAPEIVETTGYWRLEGISASIGSTSGRRIGGLVTFLSSEAEIQLNNISEAEFLNERQTICLPRYLFRAAQLWSRGKGESDLKIAAALLPLAVICVTISLKIWISKNCAQRIRRSSCICGFYKYDLWILEFFILEFLILSLNHGADDGNMFSWDRYMPYYY
jgi:hypothetical protein